MHHQLNHRLLAAAAAITMAITLGIADRGAAAPDDDFVSVTATPSSPLGDSGGVVTPAAPDSGAATISQQALSWFELGGPYAIATPQVLPTGNLLFQIAENGAAYYHGRSSGGSWSGPQPAGGLFQSTVTPAVALAAPQPPTIELFGVGLDNALWYRTGSTGWQSLGGVLISSPTAVTFGGVTYVFAIGSDHAVWYRSPTSGWSSLGGYVISDLAVTTDGSSLYVMGVGGDEAMWSRRLSGSTWFSWQYLGGRVASYPATASVGGAGYMFVIGADDAVWYQTVQAGSWSGWQPVGGIADSAPAAVADPGGGVDVFVVGGDGAMYSRRLTAGGWSSWQGLGGQFLSAPGASATQVFGIGVDGWLYGSTFI